MSEAPRMPNLPDSFRAFVVDRPEAGGFTRGLREVAVADLPPGEVTEIGRAHV
jgi:hypothetical protein